MKARHDFKKHFLNNVSIRIGAPVVCLSDVIKTLHEEAGWSVSERIKSNTGLAASKLKLTIVGTQPQGKGFMHAVLASEAEACIARMKNKKEADAATKAHMQRMREAKKLKQQRMLDEAAKQGELPLIVDAATNIQSGKKIFKEMFSKEAPAPAPAPAPVRTLESLLSGFDAEDRYNDLMDELRDIRRILSALLAVWKGGK